MLDSYLERVHRAYTTNNVQLLTSLLSPNRSNPSFIQLQQSLLSSPLFRKTSFRDATRSKFPSPLQTPFADYLANYLIYVRDTPPTTSSSSSSSKEELEKICSLLEDLYKTADRLFATCENGIFVPTLRSLTSQLIKTCLVHDRKNRDEKLTKAGEAARMLARPMGIAASDRSPPPPPSNSSSNSIPTKRSSLYFLANSTFRVYFALKNLRLCDTVLNNVQNSSTPLPIGGGGDAGEEFGKGDLCEFLYYRGRIALYQRRLGVARKDLLKSFELCHYDDDESFNNRRKNARLILIYLITASIPIGYFPKIDLLQLFNLQEQFGRELLQPLQKGNWNKVLKHLNKFKEWHIQFGNFLLLREKLELICWRNLTRQTLLVSTNGQPLPMNGPPTLSLLLLLKTARIAWKGEEEEEEVELEELDLDDIESIAVSLMDQGYLKAYILHSKSLLVLQKGKHFGFPPISSIG